MRRKRLQLLSTALLAVFLGAISALPAAVPARASEFEIFYGYYASSPSILDNDTVFGLRFGFNLSQQLNASAELSLLDSKSNVDEDGTTGTLNYDALALDLSIGWQFLPERLFTPIIFGGLGWVNVNADVNLDTPDGVVDRTGLNENSFSFNLGVAVKVSLTKGIYLRGDVRARYFEGRSSDAVDAEATLAFGLYF
jgi:opacity protein-like surface antigen